MPTFTPYPATIVREWQNEKVQQIVVPCPHCGCAPALDTYRFPQRDHVPLHRFACTNMDCEHSDYGYAAYGDDDLDVNPDIAADIWNWRNDYANLLDEEDDNSDWSYGGLDAEREADAHD